MAVAVFLLADVPSGWSQQQYLCTPTAVEGEGIAQGKDGVLVQDVSVQKGDTLSGISRRFSGHGSNYPQILLFNDIKNPDLIYPGNVFKIPVTRHADKSPVKKGKTASTGGKSAVPRKTDTTSVKKPVLVAPAAAPAKKQVTIEKKHAVAVGAKESASSQKLFERAVKSYRQDDYRTALELFDRYLLENQASPLAADASLYKAECYLKLSVQN
jgi:LysM repeat protein